MIVRGFAGPIPTTTSIDALLQAGVQHIASDITPGEGAEGAALLETLLDRGFVPDCMARCNPVVLQQEEVLKACDMMLKGICKELGAGTA